MRHFAVLWALLPLACPAVPAQNFPRLEASAGYSYTRFHPGVGVALNCNGGYGSVTGNFTNRLGVTGGIDISISCLVAIRVIEADYLLTRLNSTNQNNFRFSAGIVLRRW